MWMSTARRSTWRSFRRRRCPYRCLSSSFKPLWLIRQRHGSSVVLRRPHSSSLARLSSCCSFYIQHQANVFWYSATWCFSWNPSSSALTSSNYVSAIQDMVD
ncbi:hypothetical protein B0H11DRAFT_2282553, partial [Mycena galericulata]